MTSSLVNDQTRHQRLRDLETDQRQAHAYLPHGFRPSAGIGSPLPAFNGEYHEPLTGHYLLGNGYRAFNPLLMRFNSPDSLSPFGDGGVNAYAYCQGDPLNQVDPSGHVPLLIKLQRLITGNPQRPTRSLTPAPRHTAEPDVGHIGARSILIDRSAISRPPVKQGPLTANQTLTLDIAREHLKSVPPPTRLVELSASALTDKALAKVPKNHPIFTNPALAKLRREGPKRLLSGQLISARSDQERLIIITRFLRQSPTALRSRTPHA